VLLHSRGNKVKQSPLIDSRPNLINLPRLLEWIRSQQCLFCLGRGETTLRWGETTLSWGETTLSWGETTPSWGETTLSWGETTPSWGETTWGETDLGRNDRNSFSKPIGSKTCPGLICTDSVQFEKKRPKISRCASHSPKYVELCHITLLFLQTTAKKYTKIQNAHAQPLFCSLNLLFGVALVAVAVVVC